MPEHWTSLASVFVHQARETPDKVLVSDETGETITYGEALLKATALALHLKKKLAGECYVGIMLPPSAAGILANLALLLLGKTAVNLTYAASSKEPNIAISRCGIRKVLTSSTLLKKRSLELKAECIHMETLPAQISKVTKAKAFLVSKVASVRMMARFLPGLLAKLSDTATVMFTSGSTGNPKGVVLSHGNILSNILQIMLHGKINENDCLLGILPYFHSLGYTGTFACVFALGISVVCHNNPLESRKVIGLIEQHGVTIMLSTPTLMRSYYQRGNPDQFKTVRWLLLGSEKLDVKVAEEITAKLGLVPNEGYGCTELSPVVSGNVKGKVHSVTRALKVDGNRLGSVGQPVPGTAVAIVDRDTGELIPPGSQNREGRIFVSGPQVMQGYFKDPDRTREVLQNGWYFTGDIGYIDEDGFIHITDRESRFAKIGGEMVPMIKVELEIRSIVGSRDVYVEAVPDEKGEKLVVLHLVDELDVAKVLSRLEDAGMNKLWIPKAKNFHRVESLPVAPSGKLDLKALKRLAIELSS